MAIKPTRIGSVQLEKVASQPFPAGKAGIWMKTSDGHPYWHSEGGSDTDMLGGGGAGNPAAPFNSVQFNDGGVFGGSADMSWDGTNFVTTSILGSTSSGGDLTLTATSDATPGEIVIKASSTATVATIGTAVLGGSYGITFDKSAPEVDIVVAPQTVVGEYGVGAFLVSGDGAPAGGSTPGRYGGGTGCYGGVGGAGTASLAAGDGGNASDQPGDAGPANGGPGGNGGSYYCPFGLGTGAGTNGGIYLGIAQGGEEALEVNIASPNTPTNVFGRLSLTGSFNFGSTSASITDQALRLINSSASTNGAQVQVSPALIMQGHGWFSAANHLVTSGIYTRPHTANPSIVDFMLAADTNTGSLSDIAVFGMSPAAGGNIDFYPLFGGAIGTTTNRWRINANSVNSTIVSINWTSGTLNFGNNDINVVTMTGSSSGWEVGAGEVGSTLEIVWKQDGTGFWSTGSLVMATTVELTGGAFALTAGPNGFDSLTLRCISTNHWVEIARSNGVNSTVYTGGSQTITGSKTFSATQTFNDISFPVVGSHVYLVSPATATQGLIGDTVRVTGAIGYDSDATHASTAGGVGAIRGGVGGAAAASGSLAGAVGGIAMTSGGVGGAASTGSGAAGAGGMGQTLGGVGGAGGTGAAGAGGNAQCIGGVGGVGSASVAPATGGTVTVRGGTAGAVGGFGGSAVGGNVIIRGGAGTNGTTDNGTVTLGDSNTSAVAFGASATGGAQLVTYSTQQVMPALLVGSPISSTGVNVTIAPSAPIHHITNTGSIQTITAPSRFTGGGQVTLIPDALFTMTTGGNIAIAVAAAVNKALIMTYDFGTSLWYPSYLS